MSKSSGKTQFLVAKHGFSSDRVTNAIEKLKKAKSTHSQQRLESFFTLLPTAASDKKKPATKRGVAATKSGVKGGASKRGRKK